MMIMWGPEGPPPVCPQCGSFMLAEGRTKCINCGSAEPTAEQVAMDRERARAQRVLDESKGWCGCNSCVETIAIALRDRATEAHAAGRDEESKECEAIAVEEMCGSKRTLSERLTGKRIVEAIRALRGRG